MIFNAAEPSSQKCKAVAAETMQNNISQVCQLKLSARCATWLFVFKVKTETTFVKGHAKLECAILKMPDDQFM